MRFALPALNAQFNQSIFFLDVVRSPATLCTEPFEGFLIPSNVFVFHPTDFALMQKHQHRDRNQYANPNYPHDR